MALCLAGITKIKRAGETPFGRAQDKPALRKAGRWRTLRRRQILGAGAIRHGEDEHLSRKIPG
jgi:hypothetical protein